jgi:uncharacterized cupredoxin-like copper-binding protein
MQKVRRYGRRLFALLACAGAVFAAPPALAAADDDQAIRQHPAVQGASWRDAEELIIELGDHSYTPQDFTLKVGRPYKLVLKNVGGVAHDMVGGSFFGKDVIALRMINSVVGRVTADTITSIYIRPKMAAEIWLVTLKEGEFSYFCSVPDHRESGMEGIIQVTR